MLNETSRENILVEQQHGDENEERKARRTARTNEHKSKTVRHGRRFGWVGCVQPSMMSRR